MAENTVVLLDTWLQQSIDRLAPATQRRYHNAILHFFAWYVQAEGRVLALDDLHPITLVGYRASLQEMAAASTVNTHLFAIRAWCAWLVEHGFLLVNPAARLKLVGRQAPTKPHALTPAQVNAILRQTQQTRNARRNTAILHMLVQTGMRIGECAALRWEDISYGEKRGYVSIRAGKGNKARRVPLNESARQALADYLAPLLQTEPTLKAVAVAWQRAPREPVWASERGDRLSVREMSRMIQDLVRACAARDLVPANTTPHSLRHTFATRYLAAHRDDLVGLARLLGHSSLDATRIYVQPTEEELAARVERIDLNAYGR